MAGFSLSKFRRFQKALFDDNKEIDIAATLKIDGVRITPSGVVGNAGGVAQATLDVPPPPSYGSKVTIPGNDDRFNPISGFTGYSKIILYDKKSKTFYVLTSLVHSNPAYVRYLNVASWRLGSDGIFKNATLIENSTSLTRKTFIPAGTYDFMFDYDWEIVDKPNEPKGRLSTAFNGGTVASGDYSHAEGFQTVASGLSSHAEGNQTIASGMYSHAEGSLTSATTSYTHAEGCQTIASGQNGHAEGVFTQALGNTSHAEGFQTVAKGDYSHAEGIFTQALGNNSHAEGQSAVASGLTSHAEGYNTKAFGQYSHAEGNGTGAFGVSSHAEGTISVASGDSSHAEGAFTQALGAASHAGGLGSGSSASVKAVGSGSFNHSTVNSTVNVTGAFANDSAILGGLNHYITSGATKSVILGGVGITATTPDTVYMSKLAVINFPVYADNAAAIAGGLHVGVCYKTSTGEVRVVV